MPTRLPSRVHSAFAVAFLLTSGAAAAQDYPVRPIRLVVPYGPGGSTDTVARILGARIADSIGQQVIIDNRGGAASIPGTEIAAKAAPDGYTMLLANIALAANPNLFKKLPYDTERDLSPVGLVSTMPTVLIVHPSIPARSIKQLIVLAKARPGELNYASVGYGSINHLTTEVFKASTGTDIVQILYKGAGPAFVDLIGGRVSMMFATIVAAYPHVEAGRLIALGVSSSKRNSILPNVPTVAEAGVPGFDVKEWQLLVVPARTPAFVIERLNAELSKALQVPEARERIIGLGADPVGSTPTEGAHLLKAELARWARTVKEARIQVID